MTRRKDGIGQSVVAVLMSALFLSFGVGAGAPAPGSPPASEDRAATVPLPAGTTATTTCALALSTSAAHPGAAKAWSEFVRGSTGQQTLRDAGLLPP